MHDGCHNFFPRQAAQCHVLAYCFPNERQRIRKCEHMLVLRAFPHLAEARMVAILLATLCVTPGCLDVAIRKRADLHVSPGGRDRECPYPLQLVRLDEPRVVGSCVAESRPRRLAPNTGRSSETYLRSADSAASRGSTIAFVCHVAVSTKWSSTSRSLIGAFRCCR
jgi:hypothetical protein